MNQNLASLKFSPEQIQSIQGALDTLETDLGSLIALSPEQKRKSRSMGAGSERFCRQTLGVMLQNPQILPPNIGLADAQADLDALDQLRPILQRLTQLQERAADTLYALGSDVLAVALAGYRQLQFSGRADGLQQLRKELGALFAKSRSKRQPLANSNTTVTGTT